MKKIAFVCELVGTEREGGEQKAMLRVANSLKKLGHAVDIYTYTSKVSKLKINTRIPLKLLTLPFIRDIFFIPLVGRSLLQQLERKYDVINASSTTIATFYKPRNKLIITTHIIRSKKVDVFRKIPKYSILFNPLVYKTLSWLETKSLNNAANLIAITEEQKNFLTNRLHIKESKVNVIPNAIDTNYFKPLNMPKKNQVIFVGRGTTPKGMDTLLSASDFIKGKILIVTKKMDKKFLDIAQTKPNVIIKFDANSDELVKLYSESKVFVLPSLDEEQPLTTMEAMSCGLPVVVTRKASIKNKPDGNGVIVIENRSVDQLREKTNYFINKNQKELTKIGKVNRKYIVDNFNLDNVSKKTDKLLQT